MTDGPAWMQEQRLPAEPQPGPEFERQRDDPARFAAVELTSDEIAALQEEAREEVASEQKDLKRKAMYAQFLAEERKARDPKKQEHPILLQLAGHADCIMLDGKRFMHNTMYFVTVDVFTVLVEQMNRGWAHDDQTEVRDKRTRRRERPPIGIGYGNYLDNRIPLDARLTLGEMDGAIGKLQGTMRADL